MQPARRIAQRGNEAGETADSEEPMQRRERPRRRLSCECRAASTEPNKTTTERMTKAAINMTGSAPKAKRGMCCGRSVAENMRIAA